MKRGQYKPVGQGPSLGHSLVPVYNFGLKTPRGRGGRGVPCSRLGHSAPALMWLPTYSVGKFTWAAWIFRNPSPCLELQSPKQLGSTVPLQWWTTEIQIPSQKHWADQQLGSVNSPSRALSNDQCLGPTSRTLI